jgi:hypothetical protein
MPAGYHAPDAEGVSPAAVDVVHVGVTVQAHSVVAAGVGAIPDPVANAPCRLVHDATLQRRPIGAEGRQECGRDDLRWQAGQGGGGGGVFGTATGPAGWQMSQPTASRPPPPPPHPTPDVLGRITWPHDGNGHSTSGVSWSQAARTHHARSLRPTAWLHPRMTASPAGVAVSLGPSSMKLHVNTGSVESRAGVTTTAAPTISSLRHSASRLAVTNTASLCASAGRCSTNARTFSNRTCNSGGAGGGGVAAVQNDTSSARNASSTTPCVAQSHERTNLQLWEGSNAYKGVKT